MANKLIYEFQISMEKEYHVLEIKNVTAADQGTYTCTIKNSSGSDSAAAELEIFGKFHYSLKLKGGIIQPRLQVRTIASISSLSDETSSCGLA